MSKICIEPDCGLPHYARGFCKKHHQRQWKVKALPSSDRVSDSAFFEKVSFEPMSGCWLWMGGEHTQGYGFFGGAHGKKCYAHRWSFARFNGPLSADLEIRHTCNNTRCVNPDHLVLGTHLENMRDVAIAGTQKGQSNGSAVLFDAQVIEISNRLLRGERQKDLALEFDVHKGTIQAISSGKNWSHLTGGVISKRKSVGKSPKWAAYHKAKYAEKRGDPTQMDEWRRVFSVRPARKAVS